MTPQEEIAALKARIAELENRLPWPREGDKYFYVSSDGVIDYDTYVASDPVDIGRMSQGNILYKASEAELERDRRAVVVELRKLAKGFVPDWTDDKQEKWFLAFERSKAEAYCAYRTHYSTLPHFRTEEDLEAAIAALGDRIKVLFDGGE